MSLPFPTVLTLIFIVLKLTHVINWAWGWVLSPAWGTFVLLLIYFTVKTIKKL